MEIENQEITLSNIENLPNMEIEEHIGLVTGSASNLKNSFKNWFNYIRSIIGGEALYVNEMFEETKQKALDNMIESAKLKDATAILNIRFETIKINNNYCEVHVYGSAVKATKY